MNITGDGEKMGVEDAQTAGQPLPSRPARAAANDAKAWKPWLPVSPRAGDGAIDMQCTTEEAIGG